MINKKPHQQWSEELQSKPVYLLLEKNFFPVVLPYYYIYTIYILRSPSLFCKELLWGNVVSSMPLSFFLISIDVADVQHQPEEVKSVLKMTWSWIDPTISRWVTNVQVIVPGISPGTVRTKTRKKTYLTVQSNSFCKQMGTQTPYCYSRDPLSVSHNYLLGMRLADISRNTQKPHMRFSNERHLESRRKTEKHFHRNILILEKYLQRNSVTKEAQQSLRRIARHSVVQLVLTNCAKTC